MWQMYDVQQQILDTSTEPAAFLVGSHDLFPALSEGLLGKAAGDKVQLTLSPKQAFGDFDARLIGLEPRHLFPSHLEIGMVFETLPNGCNLEAPKGTLFWVTDVYPEHVVLDGNHPLAGEAIRFDLHVVDVRPATKAECQAGGLGSGWFQVH